jgi:hypothetical protein
MEELVLSKPQQESWERETQGISLQHRYITGSSEMDWPHQSACAFSHEVLNHASGRKIVPTPIRSRACIISQSHKTKPAKSKVGDYFLMIIHC